MRTPFSKISKQITVTLFTMVTMTQVSVAENIRTINESNLGSLSGIKCSIKPLPNPLLPSDLNATGTLQLKDIRGNGPAQIYGKVQVEIGETSVPADNVIAMDITRATKCNEPPCSGSVWAGANERNPGLRYIEFKSNIAAQAQPFLLEDNFSVNLVLTTNKKSTFDGSKDFDFVGSCTFELR